MKHSVTIYRSADDFIIGEPIKLSDIMRKKDLDQIISEADKTTDRKSSPDLPNKNRSDDIESR